MNQDALRQGWAARGYSCDIWSDPPGRVWQDCVHAVDELLMLIDGEIELRLEGRVLRPTVGEGVLIPARAAHTVINTDAVANHRYYGYRQR